MIYIYHIYIYIYIQAVHCRLCVVPTQSLIYSRPASCYHHFPSAIRNLATLHVTQCTMLSRNIRTTELLAISCPPVFAHGYVPSEPQTLTLA